MDPKNNSLSTKLSSNDIRKKIFSKAMWGVSPKEVEEFADHVAKMVEKLQKQEKELSDKVQLLSEELTKWRGKENEIERIKDQTLKEATIIKEKAKEEANKILVEVEERANEIRSRTEQWLEGVIAEVEETERRKFSFMTAFKSSLESHYELLKNDQTISEPLSSKLQGFLKSELSLKN